MRHTLRARFRRAPLRHSGRARTLGLLLAIAALLAWVVPGSTASTAGPAAAPQAAAEKIVLPLAIRDPAGLNRYLTELYRRGSRDYHHFLTPAEFRHHFGASPAEISGVLARLRSLGLTGSVAADHLYVSVPAPARSPHITTTLTSALGHLVSGVILPSQLPVMTPGLETPSRAVHAAATTRPARTSHVRQGVDGGATPCLNAVLAGAYTAPQLASAYNFNAMYAAGYHGEGMSAAVVEYGDFHDANISGFDACYGIRTHYSRVLVDGGAGSVAGSSESEVTLDMEVLSEMLPKLAHLYVYEAPNTGTGELDIYDAFVSQDRAPVLSVSWGDCEQGSSQAYERLLGAITEQAAAQGQQIFVAAGDSGSAECKGSPLAAGKSLSTDTEAALPWVTGVGGTDLSQASTAAGAGVHREDVWNDGLGAGGGGQSVTWAMPSWQRSYLAATGDHPAGMADDCGAPAGQDCRMEPDISLDADAEEGGRDPHAWGVPAGPTPAQFTDDGDRGSPGYSVYCASADCAVSDSGWQPIGGTSAATPLAAAAAVLWDQEARSAGVSLGFLNPSFYAIAANPTDYARDFYDIRGGTNNDLYTNLACLAGCGSKLYGAGPGYDMASGLGAINVGNLAADLMTNAGAITLTPDIEHMYGDTGGPTTTAAVSVTAPTLPTVPDTYSATSDATWLVVDAAPGTSLGSLAWHVDPSGLSAGTYTGTITVSAADGSTATLTVTYTVTPPAKLSLITHRLHFVEHQVVPYGSKRIQICGSPLWGDELEYRGTLPGEDGLSVAGDMAAGTRRTLRFANRGAAGSVLHYSIDQTRVDWAGNDSDPTGNPRAVQRTPGQPLVPSEGALATGHRAGIKFASYANGNSVGGYPALQQGTYHATIIIRDLADPADTVTVPVTLTLGTGRGTPHIGVSAHAIRITASPGRTRTVELVLSDPGGACGYSYSLETDVGYLTVDAARRSGSVPAHHRLKVPLRLHVPSAMAPGTYHTTVTVSSLNAAVATVRVPVTLTVR